MGRPTKDPVLHALQGTKQHASTRAPEDDSKSFVGGRLKMPANYPPEKQAVWKLLFNPLHKRKTLTKADSAAATIIVEMWLRWQAVSALAAANPIVEVTWRDSGGTDRVKQVESPASRMATTLEHKLLAALKEFSATPASREKTKKTKEPNHAAGKVMTELERITAGIAELKEQQAAEAHRNEERDKKDAADAEVIDSINLEDIKI
jgi:P27 family predicted phage terminase small subunit